MFPVSQARPEMVVLERLALPPSSHKTVHQRSEVRGQRSKYQLPFVAGTWGSADSAPQQTPSQNLGRCTTLLLSVTHPEWDHEAYRSFSSELAPFWPTWSISCFLEFGESWWWVLVAGLTWAGCLSSIFPCSQRPQWSGTRAVLLFQTLLFCCNKEVHVGAIIPILKFHSENFLFWRFIHNIYFWHPFLLSVYFWPLPLFPWWPNRWSSWKQFFLAIGCSILGLPWHGCRDMTIRHDMRFNSEISIYHYM